jgi:hypothetical protein
LALAAVPSSPVRPPLLVLTAPAPREVSFGRIAGMLPRGTVRLLVRAGSRTLADRSPHGRRVDFYVDLPLRETTVRVTAITARGRRTVVVPDVVGLPRAARPHGARAHRSGALTRRLRLLRRSFAGTSSAYVEDLSTGAGAAWNARARLPAASTLKVAIAVEVLRTASGKPPADSALDRLLRAMLVDSSNDAANALEVYLAGSTSGGGARVNSLMRSLGLVDTEMFGGYLRGTAGRTPIPIEADDQPWLPRGKYTTAHDLARLLAFVHLATEGRGLLAERFRRQFTPSDARYLLYTLAHVHDQGKLGRFLRAPALLVHKAGWISQARHDAGLVYWPGGVFVAAVMTYGRGVGVASDVLAGRVARTALAIFGDN